ncbi:MAG: hypothetical protein KF847_11600 [Pirellulales bacterium]|nr:hypothetical protein [Pirellulales bacterium]
MNSAACAGKEGRDDFAATMIAPELPGNWTPAVIPRLPAKVEPAATGLLLKKSPSGDAEQANGPATVIKPKQAALVACLSEPA